MRKAFRIVGTVLSVAAITLFLDAIVTATLLPGVINTDRDAARQQKAVWNLGVSSYSPIIYWRWVQAAAGKIGHKPSEVYVFLDLSDIEDEANIYREGPDGKVLLKSKPEPSRENWDAYPKQWLVRHFTTARLIYETVRQAVDGN